MVHIAESRVGRRFGDWFLRNGTRMHDVLTTIKSKPLPVVTPNSTNSATPAPGTAAAPAANGQSNPSGEKKRVTIAAGSGAGKPWGNATAKAQAA